MRTPAIRAANAIFLFIALPVSGCATITRGTTEAFVVTSDPPGASVTLSNGLSCRTPCSLKVSRREGFVVDITRPGYEPVRAVVSTQVAAGGAAGMAGNVILGGLIGAAVDAGSGAMNELVPNPLHVNLVPLQPYAMDNPGPEPPFSTAVPVATHNSPRVAAYGDTSRGTTIPSAQSREAASRDFRSPRLGPSERSAQRELLPEPSEARVTTATEAALFTGPEIEPAAAPAPRPVSIPEKTAATLPAERAAPVAATVPTAQPAAAAAGASCERYRGSATLYARCRLLTGPDAVDYVPQAGIGAPLEDLMRCHPYRFDSEMYRDCLGSGGL